MMFQGCILHPGAIACPTFGFTQPLLASTGTPGLCRHARLRSLHVRDADAHLRLGLERGAIHEWYVRGRGDGPGVNPGCQLVNLNASIGSYKVSFSGSSAGGSCQPSGRGTPTHREAWRSTPRSRRSAARPMIAVTGRPADDTL